MIYGFLAMEYRMNISNTNVCLPKEDSRRPVEHHSIIDNHCEEQVLLLQDANKWNCVMHNSSIWNANLMGKLRI